jgi:3-oxoadipate enol-lactonase
MIFSTELAGGPGCAVVVSHALGLDSGMWAAWAATQAGHRPVLAYDHRGHGRSARADREVTMQALVDDAASVVEGWRRGPVVFIGLSMGAMVGQGLGIQRPDLVRGLVLANTTSVYPATAKAAWAQRVAAVRSGGMAAVADMVVQRYLTEEFRRAHPDVAARLKESILANDPEAYAAACEAVAGVDWAGSLHRIDCPVLVLAGARDAGATPEMAEAIRARIPGARLQVLEDASHLSVAEQPAAFGAAVEGFLAAIETEESA